MKLTYDQIMNTRVEPMQRDEKQNLLNLNLRENCTLLDSNFSFVYVHLTTYKNYNNLRLLLEWRRTKA
jgi:hypothetical protein